MDNKKAVVIRYWLYGKGFHMAHRAMEFASEYHVGKRKDGRTQEFDHQLSIAHYIKTIHCELDFPEKTLACAFLHDVSEDYNVSFERLGKEFGDDISEAVRLCTRSYRGKHISNPEYYESMTKNPIASIVKGGDRIHNHQTMAGVFNRQKQIEYIDETETFILPMLKSARRIFTTQEPAYENIKLILKSQISLIQEIHKAELKNE